MFNLFNRVHDDDDDDDDDDYITLHYIRNILSALS